jgi:hypothetical protein
VRLSTPQTSMDESRSNSSSIREEQQLVQAVRNALHEKDRLQQAVREFERASSRVRTTTRRLRQESRRTKQESRRLQEEAHRLLEESYRLRSEAERLENDDNRNDNKLIHLVLPLVKSKITHLNLEFKANCLALRRNDPDTRMLWDGDASAGTPNYASIKGYARPLGEALKGNTVVSALYIALGNLIKSDHPNDPPNDALAYIEPLVDFVSTSPTLKLLKIDRGRRFSGIYDASSFHVPLTASFLTVIGNSSSMEELTLYDCHLPCGAFRTMMTTTASLKKLALRGLETGNDYTVQDLADLGVAFHENRSLERLWLGRECGVDQISMILSSLPNHATLQELVLFGNGNSDETGMRQWNTMGDCVCSLPSLRHLKLVAFEFSADKMRAFVDCLLPRENGEHFGASTTKLTLQECAMDYESTLLFVKFMRTKVEGDNSPGVFSRLRELCLADPPGPDMPVWSAGCLVVLLLPYQADDTQQGGGQQTIGSQLSSLSLNVSALEGFLHALEDNAPHIRLDSLRLFGFGVDCCETLKNCVDRMPCLRHLRLVVKNDQASCVRIILEMLRESGRLHSIVVEDVVVPSHDYAAEYTVALFDDVGVRLAGAYCLRNQHLAHLLERERESAQPAPSDRAGQSLFPTLLQATMQTSKSQISFLLTSLWKLGDCIGPKVCVNH